MIDWYRQGVFLPVQSDALLSAYFHPPAARWRLRYVLRVIDQELTTIVDQLKILLISTLEFRMKVLRLPYVDGASSICTESYHSTSALSFGVFRWLSPLRRARMIK